MSALPPLPASVFSAFGPIPVEQIDDLKDVATGEPLYGYWDPFKRVISVRAGMDPVAAWLTLLHERTHAELADVGVKLTTNQEERVCDALAAARLAELLDSLRGAP